MFSGCTVLFDCKKTALGSRNQQASTSAGKKTRVVLNPCHALKYVLAVISGGVDIFPGYHLLRQMSSQWGSQKLLQWYCLMKSQPTFLFLIYFTIQWIMAILSKGCKPDNFKSHNSLKLSFTNIWGLRSNFVECESFLESNTPDFLVLCKTNLDDSIESDSGSEFLCERLSSFNPKRFCYSYAWSCSLCEGGTAFWTGLISRKLYNF